jgi:hypothetical protein
MDKGDDMDGFGCETWGGMTHARSFYDDHRDEMGERARWEGWERDVDDGKETLVMEREGLESWRGFEGESRRRGLGLERN